MWRHYVFTDAGEIMPYGLVVPKGYDGTKALPLIIALHGNGGTEDEMMGFGNRALPRLAEERGFLVATPLGYRRDGGYGRTMINASGELDPLWVRMSRLSEQDVLNVLQIVRANYRVDPARIYLMGASMGGAGTWHLGSKYPEIWAGLAPIAGGGAAASKLPLANLKQHNIPVYAVHGDSDRTISVENTRSKVAELKKLGVPHEYREIPGGTHGDVIGPAIPDIVEFFSRHKRADK
jgi:predicted peptidase